MWRRIMLMCTTLFFSCSLLFYGEISVFDDMVEAASSRPVPKIAQREMKQSKDYQMPESYERIQQIINGGKTSIGEDGRTRIAIVINGDESIMVEDRVKNVVYQAIRDKFPREYFAVMKGNDVNTDLLQKAEKEYVDRLNADTTGIQRERPDVDGMPVTLRPRGLADMFLDDYVASGKKCHYDYLLVLTFSEGQKVAYNHNFIVWRSTTNHQNIWMRLRFVDVAQGKYLYRNDMAATGKGHNGFFNGKMLERSVAVLMEEAMNDIEVSKD